MEERAAITEPRWTTYMNVTASQSRLSKVFLYKNGIRRNAMAAGQYLAEAQKNAWNLKESARSEKRIRRGSRKERAREKQSPLWSDRKAHEKDSRVREIKRMKRSGDEKMWRVARRRGR